MTEMEVDNQCTVTVLYSTYELNVLASMKNALIYCFDVSWKWLLNFLLDIGRGRRGQTHHEPFSKRFITPLRYCFLSHFPENKISLSLVKLQTDLENDLSICNCSIFFTQRLVPKSIINFAARIKTQE